MANRFLARLIALLILLPQADFAQTQLPTTVWLPSQVMSSSGGVWVDGLTFVDLCSALAYVHSNPIYAAGQVRSRIYDYNKYEVWKKDPWNDATCGNGNPSPGVYLGNGAFVNATGTTIHHLGVLVFNARAAESQINNTTGCQAATPSQCVGTLLIAYNTAAPFTGSNAMACPGGGCTVLGSGLPVIDYSASPAFGNYIIGPGTISAAGIANSIGVQNSECQEQCFLMHMAIVGAQQFAIDWNGSAAQNSYIDDFEILSGNLTGGTIGTPSGFIGMRISVNAPNRHYGNGTCNTRGAATTGPITACVLVISSRGGRVHDVHYENANYGGIVDGSSNVVLENINTAAASADASTPVALVKLCAAASSAPCSSGTAATNTVVLGLQRTSPNITTNAVVDDTNTGSGTIPWASWTGIYTQSALQSGGFLQGINTVRVASDFTTAANTSLQTITGLTFTLPAVAKNYSFSCYGAYFQSTGNAVVAFGIQAASANPTNIFATGTMEIAAGPPRQSESAVLPTLATTTATAIVSGTPSAFAASCTAAACNVWELDGTIENPASAQVINIMVSTATAADAVTVMRGSYCSIHP